MKGSHTAIHDPWTPAAVEPEKNVIIFCSYKVFQKKYPKDQTPLH